MKADRLDGATFYKVINNGYLNLVAHYKIINDLNVFPVPDGDTGTNIKLTYESGLKNISSTDSGAGTIAESFAQGMLFGARGNSGVLTSQYFRGFANYASRLEELTVTDFAKAMVSAYKNAYAACVDVAEGTILTVAREGIENVTVEPGDDYAAFFEKVVSAMSVSLDNTPNLLPVLKENGVIDSGGKGLLSIFEGFLYFFTGKEIKEADEKIDFSKKSECENQDASQHSQIDFSAFNENSQLEYGYCTEFLLQLLNSKITVADFKIDDFISRLKDLGDSLVCFQTGTIVKVHIHTKTPYHVIEFAQNFGEFLTFKMENMALQHNSLIKEHEKKQGERKKLAIVCVAQGDGIIVLLKNLGADVVLNGGQTMNTSVAEMIDAFNFVNADEIILLPNESNLIKTAEQAAQLYKESAVKVVPTKNIQQGYFALSNALGSETGEAYQLMCDSLEMLTPLMVFQSGKDTVINSTLAKKGSFVEAVSHNLVGFKDNLQDAVTELLSKTENLAEKEVMFIIYGQMVNADEVESIAEKIRATYPQLEVGLIEGKQDVYNLLIGLS